MPTVVDYTLECGDSTQRWNHWLYGKKILTRTMTVHPPLKGGLLAVDQRPTCNVT